jgi:signal transduction histidine kinase
MEIDSRTATLLYVSARETVDTLLVRASATQVVIRLAAVYHGVRLTIEDNGTTVIDSEPEFAPKTRTAVELAGGSIRHDSSPSGSTRVCITLPLD